MLSNEIIEKLDQEQNLTTEEIKYVLDYIMQEAKNRNGITETNQQLYFKRPKQIEISHYTVCEECSKEIAKLCNGLKIKNCIVDTQALGLPDLKHYFEIIKFNSKENLIFIIDLTYIQFLKNTYPVYIDGKAVDVVAPGKFFSTKNKNELMWNGYITCTEQNFKDYISAFIKSNKTGRNIDENAILDFATSQVSSVFGFTNVRNFGELFEDELEKHKTNS